MYYHFRKWSADGSLERVWQHSLKVLQSSLDLSNINLDGTHSLAKKGGESVVYQYRKRAKTSNILIFSDAKGMILACSKIMAGNRHDAYFLKSHLQTAFKRMKRCGLVLKGTFFNGDSAFDTREARKTCFNHGLIPNLNRNRRNLKKTLRGRKRLFDPVIYKKRFATERSHAWIDKFRALLVRFERKDAFFLGAHHVAFAMINYRHLFNPKV